MSNLKSIFQNDCGWPLALEVREGDSSILNINGNKDRKQSCTGGKIEPHLECGWKQDSVVHLVDFKSPSQKT